ncbi:MAG: asparagine synthetase B family protein [Geminicoccaceae bacterium]
MVEGLGDFVVAKFKNPPSDWTHLARSWHWPALGGLDPTPTIFDLSPVIKAATTGSVVGAERSGRWRFALEQPLAAVSPEDVVEGRIEGFRGKFATIDVNTEADSLRAHTDPMRQIPLFALETPDIVAIATDLRLLTQLPGWTPALSPNAIYHHLNFTYIPTPYTIYENVRKVPPGTRLTSDRHGVRLERYWQPSYPADLDGSEDLLADQLQESLISVIGCHTAPGHHPACFLSGGTDSSTIASILSKTAGPENTHAFSIGFSEKDFDELDYAVTAANAFGVDHHQRRINAEETLKAIDLLVEAFDEPFGNSSAVPTYYCADLAKQEGFNCLIAGDGGDEIFGGNERYAKDYFFRLFYNLPSPVKAIGGLLRQSLTPIDRRFANKIKNFLHRGALPNPERFYTDDSFASDFYDDLLTRSFKDACPKRSSLAILDDHYRTSNAKAELNRLMYIDLQMAIADNDLSKVNRSAKAAGVSVLYPYLTPDLIQLMGRMPPALKVNRTIKRYLFKKAAKPLLPEAILTKKKQGFGLPFGHWFRHDPKIRAFLGDILLSQSCMERGYLDRDFLRSLLDRHHHGVWDYSNELWLLLMLELWHQRHFDGLSVHRHAA